MKLLKIKNIFICKDFKLLLVIIFVGLLVCVYSILDYLERELSVTLLFLFKGNIAAIYC